MPGGHSATRQTPVLGTAKRQHCPALFDNVKLVNLPSTVEAEDMAPGTAIHAVPTNLNGFSLTEEFGVARDLVRYTLLTMTAARQLDYLSMSGFVGKGWKVLVEIHYYRDRTGVGRDKFHKDTQGETLFVNLNYDTDVDIPGPEYILNPAVVQEHEKQIVQSLPVEFMDDLRWVRGQLGKPTEINIASIKPNQFVGFVDEAIHHMSPQLGGRTVTGTQLTKFLVNAYGQAMVQDASAAHELFRKHGSSVGLFFKSLLKVVPVQHADMWFNLMEIAETPGTEVNRLDLLDAGMDNDLIDRLLDENWPGYQNVSIPKAQTVPVANAPFTRQASVDALKKRVPPPAAGARRFFRTCVRIVRA